jgi:ribosome-associated heat shock protein Hsp15
VEAGKVLVNGVRAKPAKGLKPGDELQIRTPVFEYTVRVAQLAERRGAATLAAQLYAETDESKRKRAAAKLERVDRASTSDIRGRPTKRTRRQLQRLRNGPW